MIANDVTEGKSGRVLLVPELISHDVERRLCSSAGDQATLHAEVVSFTRMVRAVSDCAGKGMEPCLDNGGRLVAMAATTRQLHSVLKAYASVETKPEFLTDLVSAVDEF
jgi:ATP-dependent helicase/nuclease subunit B